MIQPPSPSAAALKIANGYLEIPHEWRQKLAEEIDAFAGQAVAAAEQWINPARYGLNKYEAENALADYKARKADLKRKEDDWRKLHMSEHGL